MLWGLSGCGSIGVELLPRSESAVTPVDTMPPERDGGSDAGVDGSTGPVYGNEDSGTLDAGAEDSGAVDAAVDSGMDSSVDLHVRRRV